MPRIEQIGDATLYLVATRRECRGMGVTAKDVLAHVSGLRIKNVSGPDMVIIEATPEQVDMLREADRRAAKERQMDMLC